MLKFYCGVDPAQQHLITEYVRHALDSMAGIADPHAEVFAFFDLRQGVAVQSKWLQTQSYRSSPANLRAVWQTDKMLGQTYRGAVFLYVGASAWRSDPAATRLTVLHEMHHLLQYDLMGPAQQPPLWLLEGGAEAFASLELADLGYAAPSRTTYEAHCDYPLKELEDENQDAPLECRYIEGARAVRLLLKDRGKPAYYQLFAQLDRHASYGAAFASAYGYPLADFYQRFGAYRRSSYTIPPDLILSSAIPTP